MKISVGVEGHEKAFGENFKQNLESNPIFFHPSNDFI